jgi:DNA-binding transcriptional regulator WhiA
MLFATANFYFKADEYKAAQTLYLDTLKKAPDYVEVKKNLARLYLTTERFDKAKEVIYYRKKYPEVSLQDLALIISMETANTITKSGLNHRLRKIKQLALKLENNN